MSAPTTNFIGNKILRVASTNSRLMALIITRDNTIITNGSHTSFYISSIRPFDTPNKTMTEFSAAMKNRFRYDMPRQYDVTTNTIVTCDAGIIYEHKTNGVLIAQRDWRSVLGNTPSGVILGYEGEKYFYVISNNTLWRCQRDLTGEPVSVMPFSSGTNYNTTWNGSANGFFNGNNIYTQSSYPYVMRTDVVTKSRSNLSLGGSLWNGSATGLYLSIYEERVVFTHSNYTETNYPTVDIFDIGKFVDNTILFQDGDNIKSYSDTGYTRDVCVAGAVISSTNYEAGHPNTDAFDKNLSTYWGSNETGVGVKGGAFIGYDFQTIPRHIRRIELTKFDTTGYTPTLIKVQYSDDGAVWTDAMEAITLIDNGQTQVIDLPATAIARRWRLLAYATLDSGKTWRVRDIKMYEKNITGIYLVGPAPATTEMFEVNGVTDLDFLTYERMAYFDEDKFKILAYTTHSSVTKANLIMNAIPHGHIVYPKGDIELGSVEQVESFVLTATESTPATGIRIICSANSGKTWKTWDTINDKWIDIDPTDLYNLKLNGMTVATLNERVASEWSTLITDKIRFAYYLEQESSNDTVKTEVLTMTADMLGTWERAKEKDYTYGYPKNNVLTVKLFTDGDYKINFDTGIGTTPGAGGGIGIIDGGTF